MSHTLRLSERQWQIARLVTEGAQNWEIARAVGVSRHCIKNYLHAIYDETGMDNRLELALWYLEVGAKLDAGATGHINQGAPASALVCREPDETFASLRGA